MNREQTEELLKRYLDGETTNGEEQQLRQYFAATPIVPLEWKAYKALFAWEDCQRNAETSEPTTYRMRIAASIAALIVIGAGLTVTLLRSSHPDQQVAKNYAVLDGRYTTDEAIVGHEAEEALLMVSASDEDAFDAIDILATP